MPQPRMVDGRRVYDRELAHAAFKHLPTANGRRNIDDRRAIARQQHGRTSTMPRKLPPFVECWRDRHGKMRAYYRRDHGPRIALPNSIGSPAFNARLSGMRLQVGCRTRRLARPAVAAQGTIEALVRSYVQSREYRDLRATTKTGYASRLETIRHEARTPARRGDDARAHRQGVPRSLCRPPRRGTVDPKDAAHPDPTRGHARLVAARSIARHQAPKAR